MNITEFSIEKRVVSFVLTILVIAGGILSYENLGRLEFPRFTIKTAVILTSYPGASALQVEQEVTDPLETAVQQLSQTDEIRSTSKPGLSILFVDIKENFMANEIPQVWDELRKKIRDIRSDLPPGVKNPIIKDDWGDEYGIFFSITGPGYSHKELKDYADFLEKELLLVKDVAKVSIWGNPMEVVNIEISRSRLAELGISPDSIFNTFNRQNMIADAGRVKVGEEYIRISPTGEFSSVKNMEDLLIMSDKKGNLIYLKDIAKISSGYLDPPQWIMKHNGKPAIGLGISTVSDGNVVTMGEAVQKKLKELETSTPVGIKLSAIAFQSDTVSKSVNSFVINLIEAVAIVIIVLCIFMGIQSGIMIGVILLITILGTFIVMDIMDISLQLISLGALILALGMLVDNAIVVTEGILVKTQQGMPRKKAAFETVAKTQWPLLGATFVAVLAFAAIGTSHDSAGEFCGSLFKVMAISLGLSWIVAVTVTPLFCIIFLPGQKNAVKKDPYAGKGFTKYRSFLNICLKHRVQTIMIMLSLLLLSIYGFTFVEDSFFPKSSRPQFMIDYWRAEGTDITATAGDLEKAGKWISTLDNVEAVDTFVGQGALRFLLTYDQEMPDSSFGQLLVTVKDYRKIDAMIKETSLYFNQNFPNAEIRLKKFVIGPGSGADIEVRFRGDDPTVLRKLSAEAQKIMDNDPIAINIKDDWRQKVKVLVPVVSEAKARRLGITRPMIANSLAIAFSGKATGLFRQDNKLLPIILRYPEKERINVDAIKSVQIMSPATGKSVSLSGLVTGFETRWQDSMIKRKNRVKTITTQCDPAHGNASVLFARLKPELEKIELPHGYEMEWGGEHEGAEDARASLLKSVPLFFLAMVVIIIILFNALRQPLIIFLCLPLALIGVTAGLLGAEQSFDFMSLLGFLSLSGMLIKNGVVLIDQIDLELSLGKDGIEAVLDSSVSRLRPVLMAAMTTVLGMTPLITDPFYRGMSVTIMSGLTFGTILTLIVVPVLYALFFRIKTLETDETKVAF
ncbi:MAG: efflux RND transporter permease subunit [Thermodesulfobacteriota bacterium]|nr:efflux RND transporter permease subunit [Thermodesulfobacteriota bacterium]